MHIRSAASDQQRLYGTNMFDLYAFVAFFQEGIIIAAVHLNRTKEYTWGTELGLTEHIDVMVIV